MRTSNHRLRHGLAFASVLCAFAVPGATAAVMEPPIPSGEPQGQSRGDQSVTSNPGSLPTPDAYLQQTGSSGTVTSQPVVLESPSPAVSDGFDWGDAGIGAGAMLALAAIAAGTALALGFNPRRSPRAA
jgi:hypothetical protein